MSRNAFLLLLFSLVLASCTPESTLTGEGSIRIGAIQPLTTSTVAVGEQVREGIDLAVEEINANGGINGRMLEVIYEDDQCNPKNAVSAFEKLTGTDNVSIIIGPTCSSNVLALAPLANEKRVIVFTTVASTDKVSEAGDYVFRNTPSGREYSYAIAQYARGELGAETASIIYLNLDNGIDFKNAFAERFTQLGGTIFNEEAYNPEDTDYRTQLLKIQDANPDVIFLAGQINPGLVIKQAREMGIPTQFIGPTTIESPDFSAAAGAAGEGVLFSSPEFDPNDPAIAEFTQRYARAYANKTLGFRTPIAYDAVMILARILEECGEDVECVKQELYATQGYMGISGETSFDENGDVRKPLMIKTVKDGKFVRAK